jgi:crotonobetainyl-CoA:carnitine CoA-transferase CaiB-like acyl-CoA transferase
MVVPGIADQVGATYFAWGIGMALLARERFGIGQQVDASLYGSQIAIQAMNYTRCLRVGQHENGYTSAIFTIYGCSDGRWLAIAILDPVVYPRLCAALGRPELATDERFSEPFARFQNNDQLMAELRAAFAADTRDNWLKTLVEHDVACGPVQDYLEVASDPQALANGYITTLEHADLGTLQVVGSPVKLSETPAGPKSCAPELGQHTEEVLLGLGYTWADIERLKDAKVV